MNRLPEIVLERIAIRLQNELILVCPVDKGRLRNSIRVIITDEGLRIIMVDYGRFVEFGTPPHTIKPKGKKALHWGGKEGPIVKEVKHPGTRPNPFVRNTLQNKFGKIVAEEVVKYYG